MNAKVDILIQANNGCGQESKEEAGIFIYLRNVLGIHLKNLWNMNVDDILL